MGQSSTAVAQPHPAEGAMRIVSSTTRTMQRVVQHPPPALSREAKRRLAWFKHYDAHRENASGTCRYFGISRETFDYWKRRYEPRDLRTLETRASRPRVPRGPTWTPEQALAVQALREQYPRWGKDKLQRLLARDGVRLSVSMVGRILRALRRRGALREPPRRTSARQQRPPRPYAERKPQDSRPTTPGDLVEVDTLDVRPGAGQIFKPFTARDVLSRGDVCELASRATAGTAARMLTALKERMPFAIKAIQVDGGSEFMAEFEQACQRAKIRLFVLPPRSPKLNGHVERAQRTHTEEFYECCSAVPTVAALGTALREWERTYNEIRPHQSLGYLTPKQFWEAYQRDAKAALAALPKRKSRRKEALSGRY